MYYPLLQGTTTYYKVLRCLASYCYALQVFLLTLQSKIVNQPASQFGRPAEQIHGAVKTHILAIPYEPIRI